MHWQAVLLDLDGTLVDNFAAIHRAYAHASAALGRPAADLDTVRRTVGGSVPVTLSRLMPGADLVLAERLFREEFDRSFDHGLVALPGAADLLAGLRARGVVTACFTNKHGPAARRVLAHVGLLDALDHVIGTGDGPGRKPEPAFTAFALGRVGRAPASTCMVGDSPFDLAAARAGGLPCYTVSTGSHTAEQLLEAGVDGVWPDLPSLGRAVFGL